MADDQTGAEEQIDAHGAEGDTGTEDTSNDGAAEGDTQGAEREVQGDDDAGDVPVRKSAKDYITDSYRTLFAEYCRTHGIEPTDMLFASMAVAAGAPVAE